MNVRAEACWSGGEKYSWRLTLPQGQRLTLRVEEARWDRETASRALDLLEVEGYGPRRGIRFNIK